MEDMHTVCGTVLKGKSLGRTLGFPTANLAIPKQALPENGVWVGMAILDDGRNIPCVLNQGNHPTLPEGQASIEAHLFDFDEDLYGKRICIKYLWHLRPEQKFDSLEALILQIKRDKEEAIQWLCRHGEAAR